MLFQTLVAAGLFASTLAAPTPFQFKIVTSNVRYDASADRRFAHEKPWDERKVGQIQTLGLETGDAPTLIGLQEVKYNQIEDVISGLNNDTGKSWTYYGIGRDDGNTAGEYAAILYDNNEWQLINGTSKWLSTTPDQPSRSWNAGNNRIVSITEMQHKSSGIHINYLNTHFDDKSEEARQQSSELIAQWISQIPNDYQTFLTGDFNAQSNDASYQTIVKSMDDTREIANDKLSLLDTYTGFEPTDTSSIIDFIWVPKGSNTQGSKVTVLNYKVDESLTPAGFRFSDHRPVVSRIQLN